MLSNKDTFQHIRRLQIKTQRYVEDFFAGIYRSAFKGQGLEFEEVRDYIPGDDIRHIDWNVTARSSHPFVKSFREERELTVLLIVDVSASSHFSHTAHLKSEMIAEIGALLAFSAIKNQDKVGLLLFSNEIELFLKPQKGVRHVLRVIRELLFFKPKNQGTDLQKALAFAGKVQRRRIICFVISDFLDTNFKQQVKLLAQHHELIAIHLYDSYEKQFPSLGLVRLKDLETHQDILVDTADARVQKQFQEQTQQHQAEVKQLFERAGASWVSICTDDSSSEALYRFFRSRGRHSA